MRRAAFALVAALAALALGAAQGSSQTVNGLQFTDWTATGGTTATGTLLGRTVTLTGWHLSDLPPSYLDGSGTFFSAPYFSPPLRHSDAIEFRAENGQPHDYTLSFSSPTTDPMLHLASLGTTLQFPSGTSITRISGKNDGFAVSGSTIIGAGDTTVDSYGNNDSNGTVRLNGTFTAITFTATTGYAIDGVLLQVGAPVPPSVTPEPTPPPPTPGPSPVPAPPALPLRTVDIRVSGIEVTQAVQASGCAGCEGTLPSRGPVTGLRGVLPPSTAIYQGARMVAGKLTTARVYATFTRPADKTVLSDVTAKLEVLDGSDNVIATLTPDSSPTSLKKTGCWTCVTAAQRADAAGSFYFTIPWQWTLHRRLSLRATVSPIRFADSLAPVSQCAGCRANVFKLAGIPFVQTATVRLHPIALSVNGKATTSTENQVFDGAQAVLPVHLEGLLWNAAPLTLPPNASNDSAIAALRVRAAAEKLTNADFPIGVFFSGEAGLVNGQTDGTLYVGGGAASVVEDDRPLTSVAHEIGHGLGLVHADTGSYLPPPVDDNKGPHPDGTDDCGGNSNDQVGETWLPDGSEVPPDNQGLLNSVGLDRRSWNVFRTGSRPRPILADFPIPGDRYYDLMSYCPAGGVFESRDWISLTNWNRLLDFHPPAQALPAVAARHLLRAPARTSLHVIATVDATGATSIFDVTPGQGSPVAPTPGSPYRIELRDAAGDPLASVVASTTIIHEDHAPSRLLLEATLPSPGSAAAAVTITAGGRDVARRARSPHAPIARLVAPRPGSRLGRRGRTTSVRWIARDADGDRLTSTVEYSPDGGRTWKVVADRVRGRSARVADRLLSASRNARLRVRVSDGFDLATATSGRLSAAGSPPRVRILDAGRRGAIRAGQLLLLEGLAFDDAGRALAGGRLKWYAGRRPIGRGEHLTVRRLPPGAATIRLVATDSHGRSARAALRLGVRASKPVLTAVRAPATVSAHARRIRISVVSNVPATFTIARARHKVTAKLRRITIPIRPGRSKLQFPYSLRSPGGVARGIYAVSRDG